MYIRPIKQSDDPFLAQIIRDTLSQYQLDIPGTAYFDPELDHLSEFYQADDRRAYFVLTDETDTPLGGIGLAEYDRDKEIAELQKLYISKEARGQKAGYQLIEKVLRFSEEQHYQAVYLETHHRLDAALHLYTAYGFKELSQPLRQTQHNAMDRFFIRQNHPNFSIAISYRNLK